MGTRVEVAVKGTCVLKRLEKIGRSDKRRPLCTLLAPCGTDRYLDPLIGRINGAGCGAKGEAGPKCSAGGQREMDGTREKKRRFHLKKGSWIAKGGRAGWRMERSSKASSIPTDNAVATDIEDGFSVARCVYANILGVLVGFFSFRRKIIRFWLGAFAFVIFV